MIWKKDSSVRNPAVSGRFYSADPIQLIEDIKTYTIKSLEKKSVLGIISPHAGFIYSGKVAGSVYSSIKIPETVILIGPNHTGEGPPVSIMTKGCWKSPFGSIEIDEKLAQILIDGEPIFKKDTQAHIKEHSLETQLPFLQFFRKNIKIVPICLKRIGFDQCTQIGQSIADSIKKYDKEVLIVASSDMSHFESHDKTVKKDRLAIDHILDLDPRGLYSTVKEKQITMCGINPAVCMLTACAKMGSKKANLIQYKTSGEVNGDMERVVGYAGITVQ
jgi:AmmeMemoRadiSam system protein B